MAIFLPGYNGVIWNAAKASIAFASTNLNSNNLQSSKTLARAVAATLKNSASAISANMTLQGLQTLFVNLAPLLPLALGLDSTTTLFMQNRISALQAAALSIQSLLVQPLNAATQLAAGQAAVPDPMYLEWLVNFTFEAPPISLAGDPFTDEYTNEYGAGPTLGGTTTIALQAQAEATAWTTIATALRQQGTNFSGTTFNTVMLMANVSQVVANAVANAQLPTAITSTAQLTMLWNQFVAMPALTRAASAVVSDPTSLAAQNTAVIRYVIQKTLQQFNALIVSLRQVVSSQLQLGTVRLGDSLMTFANRELNDYTAWRKIAQINGLQPPYISTVPAPNVAVPGQQLFLPATNSNVPIVPQTGPVANYTINFLGVDRFLGPINQPMLPWTGDYQIISGYKNLALSLGRRLQTTVGSLIYHNNFGSRIPPEIGKIASGNELLLIQQYSVSALLSDPRVNKIVSCTATAGPNYSIVVNAVVLPNGLGQEEVTVNEVLGPA